MRGLGSALRLALAGASGGLQGYGAQQEERRRAELLASQQRRQSLLDDAAIRGEQRSAVAAGMVPLDQFDTGGIAGGRDMPGATPRQPVFQQEIGGTTFALGEAPAHAKHRDALQKALATRGKADADMEAFVNSITGQTLNGQTVTREQAEALYRAGGSRSSMMNAMFPRQPRPTAGQGKAEPSEVERDRIGRQFLAANSKNPALMNALNATFASDPSLADSPGLAAYQIMKSRTVPTGVTANRGFTPPKPPAAKKKGGLDDYLERAAERRQQGATGSLPEAGTPRPGAPGTPIPRPTAPSLSLTERERAEQQQLWDQAVAQYGQERVLREFGPRP